MGQKAREPRQAVQIGARVKSERGWSDVVIRNVSPGGMMGVGQVAPERGDYVEIRCGTYVVVARVAWARNGAFGLQSQFRIDLGDLEAGSKGRAVLPAERRKLPRSSAPRRRPTVGERAAASTRLARRLDFLSIALTGAALAGLAGNAAYQALAAPFGQAQAALVKGNRSDIVR